MLSTIDFIKIDILKLYLCEYALHSYFGVAGGLQWLSMQSRRIARFIPKPLQSVCLLLLMKVVSATSVQMFVDGLMQKKTNTEVSLNTFSKVNSLFWKRLVQ